MPATLPTPLAPIPEHKAKALVTLQFRSEWLQETEKAQRWLLKQFSRMEPILHAKPQESMIKVVADLHHENRGNFRKRYFAFKRGLDGKCFPFWEQMINRRDFPRPNGKRGLPVVFRDHWKGEQEKVSRLNDCGKQAHRSLMARLLAWRDNPTNSALVVPGYPAPPKLEEYCAETKRQVPRGWSYRNLIRYKPLKFESVYIKTGPKAAAGHLPNNLGTRTDLCYRRRLMIDDQVLDNKVVHLGNSGKPMRPECFNVLDQYTAHHEFTGMHLRRWDQEAGVERSLDQESCFWTVAMDLNHNGFRDDELGSTYVQELGTAHLPEWMWEELYNVTDGRVFYDQSGRFDQSMIAQTILGKGAKLATGNSRYKASIESSFHIIRTLAGNLRGSTSLNERDFGPEHNPALVRYCMGLYKAIDKLPKAERHQTWELLQFPFHTFPQFTKLMALVFKAANARRDHRIEGWSKCGFVLPGFINPFSELPEDEREPLTQQKLSLMDPHAANLIMELGERRDLTLSPVEAKELCISQAGKKIVRLGFPRIASILKNEWSYPRRLGGKRADSGIKVDKQYQLKIRDTHRFGDETLIYFAFATNDRGTEIPLSPGSEYMVFICPFAPDTAILKTLAGRYVGTVPMIPRIGSMDRAARLKQQGKINHYRSTLEAGPKRRHAEDVTEMEDMIQHNDRVTSGETTLTNDQLSKGRLDQARADFDEAEEAGIITIDPDDIEDWDAQASNASDSYVDQQKTGSVFAHNPALDD